MSRQRQAIGSARQRLKSTRPVTAFGCLEIQDHFCLQLEAVELEQSTTRPPVDQKTSARSLSIRHCKLPSASGPFEGRKKCNERSSQPHAQGHTQTPMSGSKSEFHFFHVLEIAAHDHHDPAASGEHHGSLPCKVTALDSRHFLRHFCKLIKLLTLTIQTSTPGCPGSDTYPLRPESFVSPHSLSTAQPGAGST